MSEMGLDYLELADWRRQVAEMYTAVRQNCNEEEAWCDFRSKRDKLFATHPMTPLNAHQKERFTQLPYFPYNPAYRVTGAINHNILTRHHDINIPNEGIFHFVSFAEVHFELGKRPLTLTLYWVQGYGGGLFLPFRDGSNGKKSYGGGRYLYDGIKGADLSKNNDSFILDFNFAYNPSCAYNDQWICPLAPEANHLSIDIDAGEKAFD